jgi:hypothetical protein
MNFMAAHHAIMFSVLRQVFNRLEVVSLIGEGNSFVGSGKFECIGREELLVWMIRKTLKCPKLGRLFSESDPQR